jgi:hypothetical protein
MDLQNFLSSQNNQGDGLDVFKKKSSPTDLQTVQTANPISPVQSSPVELLPSLPSVAPISENKGTETGQAIGNVADMAMNAIPVAGPILSQLGLGKIAGGLLGSDDSQKQAELNAKNQSLANETANQEKQQAAKLLQAPSFMNTGR